MFFFEKKNQKTFAPWRARGAGVASGAAFFVVCAVLLLRQMRFGIWSVSFDDENMHVVGARVLNAGGMLYRDFVDLHGPLIFALLQLYGHLAGWAEPNHTRLIIAGAALAAWVTLCCGPGLAGPRERLTGGALFAALLAAVWIRQGLNLTSFYPLAGALAVIALGAFVLGAWRAARLPAAWCVTAGAALALLCATAYSFAPTALCFAASGGIAAWRHGQRRALAWLAAGAGLAGAAMLAWMWRFADLHGYLAFHILESQVYYPPYIGFSPATFLRSLIPHIAPDHRIQTLAVIAAAAAGAAFLAFGRRSLWSVAEITAGFLGILALNARGMPIFQDGAFLMAALAAFAAAAARLAARAPQHLAVPATAGAALLAIAVTQLTRGALTTPFGLSMPALRQLGTLPIQTRSDAPAFARIRALVPPGEHILALIYDPAIYLAADRLPIRLFYTYFPWDAHYARAPFLGRPRDLCVTLAEAPPPVITYDATPVWGFDPHRYMPCLFTTLARDYVQDAIGKAGNAMIFVRKDKAKK